MAVTPLKQKATRAGHERASSHAAMKDLIANELIFGVVGPVGSGTSEIANSLESLLKKAGYDASILKARDVIIDAAKHLGIVVPPTKGLAQTEALQDAGDRIRAEQKDNAAVAVGLIQRIRAKRAEKQNLTRKPGEPIEPDGEKRAYILDSLRHPHEVALLRRVYQDAFCLVGVFCYENERLQRLRDKKYRDAGSAQIESFMERDENAPESHGQKVADTFHLADYFIDNSLPRFNTVGGLQEENPDWDVSDQLGRLIDILTHRRIVRPSLHEMGMFHAHGAKMRSSCLSRQVGAALLDSNGTLIATGTNEVPRAGGGVYGGVFQATQSTEGSPATDFRCFIHNGYCSNTRTQNDIIRDLFKSLDELRPIELDEELLKRVRKTRIGQLLEFSRSVHAEMDALLSAARSGAKTGGTRLYVTTFPCHNCARHIVTAGAIEVQYIEPYLKSQAIPLHGDAIVTDIKSWNNPKESTTGRNPNVLFRPFIGVAPRLYRRAFFKDRDLKNNVTGDMITEFGPTDGFATTETLRVSYAQVEATLAELSIGEGT